MNKELLDIAFTNIIKAEANYIKTGNDTLDRHLKPYGKGSVITITSRESSIQEPLLKNLCKMFLTQGKSCLYFSFEHSKEDFVKSLMLQTSGVEIKYYPEKIITKEILEQLEDAKKTMSDWDLHICDKASLSLEEFENLIEKIKPDYVFIDSINSFNLDVITMNYFVKKLRELASSKELTSDEFKSVNGSINKLLEISNITLETNISAYDAIEILEDIDCKTKRCFSKPMDKFHWRNISVDYIAENLKSIATRQNAILIVKYLMKNLPNYFDVSAVSPVSNIDSESLKKNSDVVMVLNKSKIIQEETEHGFSANQKMRISFYKGDENIGGCSGLSFDCATGELIEE